MSSLRELQTRFHKILTDPSADTSSLVELIQGTEKLPPEERVSIYRRLVSTNHVVALKDTFRIIEQLVGPDYFKQLAKGYFTFSPSTEQDLNKYGDTFPEYLEKVIAERPEASELTYLPDVARLEWLAYQAHFAEDLPEFDFEAFGQASIEPDFRCRFVRNPSLSFLSSPYPLEAIWDFHTAEDNLSEPIDFESGPTTIAVWKHNFEVFVEPVSGWEVRLADGLLEPEHSLESFVDLTQSEALDLPPDEVVPRFISRGWIVGFESIE